MDYPPSFVRASPAVTRCGARSLPSDVQFSVDGKGRYMDNIFVDSSDGSRKARSTIPSTNRDRSRRRSEPGPKAQRPNYIAARDRFRSHNGRSALAAGTALPAPKGTFEIRGGRSPKSAQHEPGSNPERAWMTGPNVERRITVLDCRTLMLVLEPISVNGLLCSIAADRHAAPPSSMAAGS
jgi:hypothetical protein